MALLLEDDYKILADSGLRHSEIEPSRILIIENYPLPKGMYVHGGNAVDSAEVLVQIPANYNTSGIDMLWTYPRLSRSDGKPIPATSDVGGGDPRHVGNKEYCRWSRHWPAEAWKSKEDNVQKILSRIEWALQNPDADQK